MTDPYFPGQTPERGARHAVPMTDPQPTTQRRPALVPTWAKVVGMLAVLLVVGLIVARVSTMQSAGASTVGAPAAAAGAAAGGPYTVTLDGDGSASVALNEDGAGSQQTDVSLPYSTTVDSGVRILSVVGQLSGPDSGNGLACSITDAAGDVVQSSSSAGDYTTVTCSASLQ